MLELDEEVHLDEQNDRLPNSVNTESWFLGKISVISDKRFGLSS